MAARQSPFPINTTLDGRHMLTSGEFASIGEPAEGEGIASPPYMPRVRRFTLLAPDIVEAISDGRRGPEVTLARVLEPFPTSWLPQGTRFLERQIFAFRPLQKRGYKR